ERAADESELFPLSLSPRRAANPAFHRAHRFSRAIVKLGQEIFRSQGARKPRDRVAELPPLDRGRSAVKAVQIRDAQGSAVYFARRASSLAWRPPKPPLLMTSTLSPGRAAATMASVRAPRSAWVCTRSPSGFNHAAGSHARFAA